MRKTLMFLFLALSFICPAQEKNLIGNGDFGEGTKGWNIGTAGQLDSTIYKTPEATNEACDKNSLRTVSEKLWESVSYNNIKVDPGASYSMGFWMKTRKASFVQVNLNWLDTDGKPLSMLHLTNTSGTVDWYYISSNVTAPAKAASMNMVFMTGGKNDEPGMLWIDSVSFEKWSVGTVKKDVWEKAIAKEYGESGTAGPMTEKIIYYDMRHDSAGVNNIDHLIQFFTGRGFTLKNADELKSWMDEKISKGADGTVCLLPMGIVPNNICEGKKNATFKKYMKAGGRIVWIGDVPLFYLSHTDRNPSDMGAFGGWSKDILGFKKGAWSSEKKVGITESGKKWGITCLESGVRTETKDSVTVVFSELEDSNFANSHFTNYNQDFPYSGFIKYRGPTYNGEDDSVNRDLYRLALYRGAPIAVPTAIVSDVPQKKIKENAKITLPFHNYKRGDRIKVKIELSEPEHTGKLELILLDEDKVVEKYPLAVKALQEILLETSSLAPARDYTLRAESTDKDGKVAASVNNFRLCHVKTAKLPVGVYAASQGSSQYKANIILKDLSTHLGEGGLITLNISDKYSYAADQALRYDLKVVGSSGCYYKAAVPKNQSQELQMRLSNGKLPVNYHYGFLGNRAPVCMGNPINREKINEFFKQELKDYVPYPAFANRHFVNDDCGMFGDPGAGLLVCYCDYCKENFKKLTGHDAPITASAQIRKDKGILDDNDAWYRWMKFRAGTVYGEWSSCMERAASTVSPGIKIAPLPAGMGGSPVLNPAWALNAPDNYAGTGISSYYYYPFLRVSPICHLIYGEVALMGNRNNELWPMPQCSDYNCSIPRPELHVALVRGQYFSCLAAGAKAIVFFHYSPMAGTAAWEEFKQFSPLGVKFGPLLLNSVKTPRKIAVLASYCDASYRWSTSTSGNYESVFLKLRKNNIQADFISDEEITSGALKNYRCLVIGNDEYMLKSVASEINKFIEEKGAVFLDKNSRLAISGAQKTSIDESIEIAKQIIPQDIMIDSERIISSEFDAGKARLFVLVNDKIDEKASGKINVPGCFLYDLRKGQEIANGSEISLEAGDGTLILAVPEKPCTIDGKVSSSGVSVTVFDNQGKVIDAIFPIEVNVFGPDGKKMPGYSDYYATTNGRLNISLDIGKNDPRGNWTVEITELSSGTKTRLHFER